MIVVQGDFVFKAGHREAAIAAMIAVAEGVKQEPGCIRYHFYADLADPNKFIVYEEWESLEHLNAHGSADNPPPHMVTFRKANEGIRESASVHFMTAERIER
ncbi:MAG: antibiotic biosynthesis monooxygenase [Anaerolineae bacterium]|nr:antibiotic biosynthesis monooxygenase [Anaerolineae bacterium]